MQRNLEKQLKWLRLEEAKTGDAENNKEVDEVGFQYVRRQEGVQASGQVEAARLSTRERRYDLEISITWICVLVYWIGRYSCSNASNSMHSYRT